MVLRDNAANVSKAFTEEEGIPSAGCLSHSLQLVIKGELFVQKSVATLIDKVRKVCSHASYSNLFCAELRRQIKCQMPEQKELTLKRDCPTRWNR